MSREIKIKHAGNIYTVTDIKDITGFSRQWSFLMLKMVLDEKIKLKDVLRCRKEPANFIKYIRGNIEWTPHKLAYHINIPFVLAMLQLEAIINGAIPDFYLHIIHPDYAPDERRQKCKHQVFIGKGGVVYTVEKIMRETAKKGRPVKEQAAINRIKAAQEDREKEDLLFAPNTSNHNGVGRAPHIYTDANDKKWTTESISKNLKISISAAGERLRGLLSGAYPESFLHIKSIKGLTKRAGYGTKTEEPINYLEGFSEEDLIQARKFERNEISQNQWLGYR